MIPEIVRMLTASSVRAPKNALRLPCVPGARPNLGPSVGAQGPSTLFVARTVSSLKGTARDWDYNLSMFAFSASLTTIIALMCCDQPGNAAQSEPQAVDEWTRLSVPGYLQS